MAELYAKPALTFQEQLQQLLDRGMVVADPPRAIGALSSISYYRLSAYWYPFRRKNTDGKVTDHFDPGTRFDSVLELYEFDRRLRLLVMDAIERVEVAIRTRITYHMGHAYGAFAHMDPANFHSGFAHADWLNKLVDETKRSSDEFLRHYQKKYQGFPVVPVWMVTEVMTLGALSLFYKGLVNDQKAGVEDKKAVASHFNVHHKQLGDWLHTLTYVRNVCAHHSRLWNRELSIRPYTGKNPDWLPPASPRNDRIFYVLLILRHLLRATTNSHEWKQSVEELLTFADNNPQHALSMGIPVNWRLHPVWR